MRCELIPLNLELSKDAHSLLGFDDPKIRRRRERCGQFLSPRELFAVNEWISVISFSRHARSRVARRGCTRRDVWNEARSAERRVDVATDYASFDRKPNAHQGRSRRRSSFFDEVRLAQSKTFLFRVDVDANAVRNSIREVTRLSYVNRDEPAKFYVGAAFKSEIHARSSARSYAYTCAMDG